MTDSLNTSAAFTAPLRQVASDRDTEPDSGGGITIPEPIPLARLAPCPRETGSPAVAEPGRSEGQLPVCFFAHLGRCGGRLQRAHWIPKQRLRKAGFSEEQVWDRRVWTLICEAHHTRFDSRFIRLAESDYPPSLHEYAAEHGLYWAGERDGWLVEAA